MSDALRIPEGSVVITPTEMYSEMRAVRDEVKHLAAIVDPALNEVRSDVSENKTSIESLWRVVRGLENRVWFASGFAAAVGGLGGYVATALTSN